ncbi:hypothetical protein LOK49_LG01G01198 [Camellia lanceoleosa]|uniref:Uncharacterized protein n=1 Tax=Camellia lanceoleosa TaxID=1840588 RepID=A0ACC0IYM7_9ERIC|nr:hypothetical protein LOK49_LG01G01198 [Camellia lanceoleosa]
MGGHKRNGKGKFEAAWLLDGALKETVQKEQSDDIVGVGGRDDDDRSGRMDDDDDQWKKTKQRRHGFGRNIKKAKRVTLFRFRKTKKFYESLRALIEKNDFYSNECNPHLDSDNKDVN